MSESSLVTDTTRQKGIHRATPVVQTTQFACTHAHGARGGEGASAPSCHAPQGLDQTKGNFPSFLFFSGCSAATRKKTRVVATPRLFVLWCSISKPEKKQEQECGKSWKRTYEIIRAATRKKHKIRNPEKQSVTNVKKNSRHGHT